MQILELVLYGKNGKVRHLYFKLGTVNIITGKSKSGKSAVGDIIEYCLGGEACNIADGVVRDNVEWYGLLLDFDYECVFVARKNPDNGKSTTSLCYYKIGKEINVPERCDFSSNSNVKDIEDMLSTRIGIAENNIKSALDQNKSSFSANIRHSLFYCFQGQDEIAAKNILFHRQNQPFIEQTIKETIPYFLGAFNEYTLLLENERNKLKRDLKYAQHKQKEHEDLIAGGNEIAISLINEARQVGLISPDLKVDYNNYDSLLQVLYYISDWTPETEQEDIDPGRLSSLQSRLTVLQNEYNDINLALENAKTFEQETFGYTDEAGHQKTRLESIKLFDYLNFNPGRCPFCSGNLENPILNIEMIKVSIENLDKTIENVTREKPKLAQYTSQLSKELFAKAQEIKGIRSEIKGAYYQEKEKSRFRDINIQKGKVVGRISLWLESQTDKLEIESQKESVDKLEKQISEINQILSEETIEERKQYALSRIQKDMSEWAKELGLEDNNCPYRLDINKATVIVDKEKRPVPLKQLGSGANWIGAHLITYFALQKYFIEEDRPVPRFLFLDQPSQVYFPSQTDEKEIDNKEVRKIYQFIFERAKELNGNLQVIVVDHANYPDSEFNRYICENWQVEDKNLVPRDWYSAD